MGQAEIVKSQWSFRFVQMLDGLTHVAEIVVDDSELQVQLLLLGSCGSR